MKFEIKIIISRVGGIEILIFYAKGNKDKEDLSSLLEEIFIIGEFCLYHVGPDILLCWEANTIEKFFIYEETKHNNKSNDQNTLEQK